MLIKEICAKWFAQMLIIYINKWSFGFGKGLLNFNTKNQFYKALG
jgi:hypothetical protein